MNVVRRQQTCLAASVTVRQCWRLLKTHQVTTATSEPRCLTANTSYTSEHIRSLFQNTRTRQIKKHRNIILFTGLSAVYSLREMAVKATKCSNAYNMTICSRSRFLASENYRVVGLTYGVVCVILSLAVLVEHRLVTDRHKTATCTVLV